MPDVAVVGAGPAGLAAAVTAAQHGCSVALVDAAPRPGGQIWRQGPGASLSPSAMQWLRDVAGRSIEHHPAAEVIDCAGRFTLQLAGASSRRSLTAAKLILATGARELFLPFPGWTLPGVMGVGGAQALLKGGLSVRGRRALITGSGPLLLPVAASLARAGAHVLEVVEQARGAQVRRFAVSLWRQPARLLDAARYRASFARTPYRTGTWVVRAEGEGRLQRVALSDGRVIECDMLCTGYGLVPATELARLLGCAIADHAVRVDAHQQASVHGVYCAGETTGVAGVDAAVAEGRIAGLHAAGATVPLSLARRRDAQRRSAALMDRAFALRDELRHLADGRTLLCRCEDVTVADAARCGGAREAKLLTRAGMGACQGRVCGPAARQLFGWEEDSVRAPIFPASVQTMIDAYGDDHAEG